jgi:hypothetical protein
MKIERAWSMSNKWTFKIKPILKLLLEEIDLNNEIWLDPFAGNFSPAHYRNDINPDTNTQEHMDAIEWLKTRANSCADGILLDPPYSLRQISEHYKRAGIKITGWHTSSGWQAKIKDEVNRIVKVGGKVITFGWNSNGMGKSRGFEKTRILLVAHGGNKNDTIVVCERKCRDINKKVLRR